MINFALWVGLIITAFSLIVLSYRLFGLTGLYSFSALSIVVANIQVLKQVDIFGWAMTMGAVVYSASFLITDIISELYGEKKAKGAVYIGFWSMLLFVLLSQFSLEFIPSARDWAHPHMLALFSILPRILLASIIGFLISNLHDVKAFTYWKKRFPAPKHIWIRNNASTVVSQLIDTFLFISIAFIGVFPLPVMLQIMATTYVFKVLIALADTPFVYLAAHIHSKTKGQGLFLQDNFVNWESESEPK